MVVCESLSDRNFDVWQKTAIKGGFPLAETRLNRLLYFDCAPERLFVYIIIHFGPGRYA